MNAIREIQDVTSGAVTITLPSDFHAKRVEVIVLAIEESATDVQDLQTVLLNAPTLTEQELQAYQDVREWMNQCAAKQTDLAARFVHCGDGRDV